jgi:hypothetical protein
MRIPRQLRQYWALLAAAGGLLLSPALVACDAGNAANAAQPDETTTVAPATIQSGSLSGNVVAEVVPMLLSPRPGASVAEPQPLFQWGGITGTSHYQVELSGDNRFTASATVSSGPVQQTSWRVASPLHDGMTYYWRVRSVYNGGRVGAWSDYSPFVVPVPTPTPTNAAPPYNGLPLTQGTGVETGSLRIWDPGTQELLTTPGKSLGDVLHSLDEGRVYMFLASVDVVISPREFGINKYPIHLRGGQQLLVLWQLHAEGITY